MPFVNLQMSHSEDLQLAKCHKCPWEGGGGGGGVGGRLVIGRAIILKLSYLLVDLRYIYNESSFSSMLTLKCPRGLPLTSKIIWR